MDQRATDPGAASSDPAVADQAVADQAVADPAVADPAAADPAAADPVAAAPPAGATADQTKKGPTVPVSRLKVVAGPRRPLGTWPSVFAALSALIVLAAVAVFLLRPAEPAPRTPEEAVREFLAATFLARSPERVAAVICSGWDPHDAINRTRGEFDSTERLSWDEFQVVTSGDGRLTMRVRIGIRQYDALRPSSFEHWRFRLRDQDGWRVCEAAPIGLGQME